MTDQEKYDVRRTIKFIKNTLGTVDHPRQVTVILVSLEESGFLKTSYDLNIAVNNHFFPIKISNQAKNLKTGLKALVCPYCKGEGKYEQHAVVGKIVKKCWNCGGKGTVNIFVKK